MNPEAGLIQSAFRSAVERIHAARPMLPTDEVYRLAHASLTSDPTSQHRPEREVVPAPPPADSAGNLVLQF